MSPAHLPWLVTGSADRPMIFTPRRSNSGLIFAIYPSSVVHTGVKSFGCENSTTHLSPIQSWKRILPSVVSAWKSGAAPLIARVITHLRRIGSHCPVRTAANNNCQATRRRQLPTIAQLALPAVSPAQISHVIRAASWTDAQIQADSGAGQNRGKGA